MTVLETQHLYKRFLGKEAVKDVSIRLEAGKVYGLLGQNGSGKSTFMKMVAGLCCKTEGDIKVMNKGLGKGSKKLVAYMPTEKYIYDYMNIQMVGRYYEDFYEDFSYRSYEELISYMDLDMSMKAIELSSGMLAKLKIAATLSRDASLYMLDEPLNGIDLIARDLIMSAIVKKANKDNTVLISSHLVDVMEDILDEVIFIKDGAIILEGPVEAIRHRQGQSIVEIYKEVYA